MTDAETEREYRLQAAEETWDAQEAQSKQMRSLEDRVKELERIVRELYEEKMSRLHGG